MIPDFVVSASRAPACRVTKAGNAPDVKVIAVMPIVVKPNYGNGTRSQDIGRVDTEQTALSMAESVQQALLGLPQYQVVSRTRAEELAGEIGFQLGDDVDSSTVAEFGKQIGADGLVTGTVEISRTDFYFKCTLQVQLVHVETGVVVWQAITHISQDADRDTLLRKLGLQLGSGLMNELG
jgi:hypothetical protein